MDRETEERIARNDALFREMNERVRAGAERVGITGGSVPFICECADRSCTEVVPIGFDEYAAVRSNPRRFLVVPGHERGAEGSALVVETHERYLVVEKVGHAGEVAEQLAPGRAHDRGAA